MNSHLWKHSNPEKTLTLKQWTIGLELFEWYKEFGVEWYKEYWVISPTRPEYHKALEKAREKTKEMMNIYITAMLDSPIFLERILWTWVYNHIKEDLPAFRKQYKPIFNKEEAEKIKQTIPTTVIEETTNSEQSSEQLLYKARKDVTKELEQKIKESKSYITLEQKIKDLTDKKSFKRADIIAKYQPNRQPYLNKMIHDAEKNRNDYYTDQFEKKCTGEAFEKAVLKRFQEEQQAQIEQNNVAANHIAVQQQEKAISDAMLTEAQTNKHDLIQKWLEDIVQKFIREDFTHLVPNQFGTTFHGWALGNDVNSTQAQYKKYIAENTLWRNLFSLFAEIISMLAINSLIKNNQRLSHLQVIKPPVIDDLQGKTDIVLYDTLRHTYAVVDIKTTMNQHTIDNARASLKQIKYHDDIQELKRLKNASEKQHEISDTLTWGKTILHPSQDPEKYIKARPLWSLFARDKMAWKDVKPEDYEMTHDIIHMPSNAVFALIPAIMNRIISNQPVDINNIFQYLDEQDPSFAMLTNAMTLDIPPSVVRGKNNPAALCINELEKASVIMKKAS